MAIQQSNFLYTLDHRNPPFSSSLLPFPYPFHKRIQTNKFLQMLHGTKVFRPSMNLHQHPPPPQPPPPPPQPILQLSKLSRRELTIFGNSSLLLLLSSATLEQQQHFGLNKARAEDSGVTDAIADPDGASPSPSQDAVADPEGASPSPSQDAVADSEGASPSPTQDAVADAEGASPSPSQDVVADLEGASPIPSQDGGEEVATKTKRVFIDVSIDGKPAGRIVIGLYEDDVPVGAARFSNLVSGAAGITYRRKEFIKITPSYVQHGGVRSYGVDAELARSTTGNDLGAETLVDEWERQNERGPPGTTKNLAGSVGIIVRNPSKPPPKMKLVAKKGKLEIDQEEVGVNPNGTEFVIATKDSPELDGSALVIGKVLEGMEVAERIGQVKTVQDNTSSPYFRVAKLIGDKRAVVAERGFNRPYSKVIITNCGLME
ncbi:Peptidyl-prolyl cis-trans isomerase CYP26-2, chloroplastic [Linum grandiflorum]